MKTSYNLIIGLILFQMRKSKGLQQRDVAKLASLDLSFISRVENGVVGLRVDTLVKICAVFEMSLGKIFTEADNYKEYLSTIGIETVYDVLPCQPTTLTSLHGLISLIDYHQSKETTVS